MKPPPAIPAPAWLRLAVAALALLLPAAPARAEKPARITVVCDDNYPPYIFRDAEGHLRGILPDQWALWEKKTGVQVDLQAMDWAEAQRRMRAGDADVIDTIFRTPEREQLYAFTPPYARIRVPVYAHRSLGGLADISSLHGFTIGVKAGDAVVEQLTNRNIDSLVEYPSYESIVLAAKSNDLKVFSIDEPAAIYYLYKHGVAPDYRQSFLLYTGEFHRAVARDRPEILALVQRGFQRISATEYRQIDEKWLGTPFGLKETLRRWLPLLMVVATVILLLAGLNLILRKQVRARTAELSQALAQLRQSLAEREKAAAELRRSHAYFETMFNAIDDALFIHDAETGQLLDVNQRMVAMYGFSSREEVLALPSEKMFGTVPPYTWEDARAWLRKARDEGPQTFEWRAPRRDGQLFWVEVNLRLARVGPDNRTIVTVRDITERKRAEEERRRYDRRLQEAQKLESLGMLAGGIAHDFNNLLTAILGNIDLALLDIPKDSSARADLATAVAATRRAADLAQQMLAYSGKGHFVIEPLDLAAEIRSTTHMLQASISKSAELRINLPATLPSVEADASQLRQVIMNLVINASEALEKQPGVVTIAAGTLADTDIPADRRWPPEPLAPGPYVFLEVADTGAGIRPEFLAKIFEPFFSTKFTGRGLGLAAVLGIVRSHKGAIQVASTPGQGTTFRVYLPASTQVPAVEPPPPAAPPLGTSSGLILLVDDEASLRETAAKLLVRMGYQVLCAADGDQAIQLFRLRAPQVAGIILDLAMPRLDGVQTLEALRRIRADVPVLISSGYSQMDVLPRFGELHVNGFIQKPYTLDVLRAALDQHLPP